MADTFFGMPADEAREKLREYSRFEDLKGLSAAMYTLLKESAMEYKPVDPYTVGRIGKTLKDMGVILSD